MFDPSLRIGRIGYEAQTRFLVDPRVLLFDPAARKLGTRLDPDRVGHLEHAMPPGWDWVADPSRGGLYWPEHEPLPVGTERWFVTDHAQRWADAVGFRSYYTWQEHRRVVLQLELCSEPLPPSYGEAHYAEDWRRIATRCLPELLARGVIGAWPGDAERQISSKEQVNLEITDVRWPRAPDPARKLMAFAVGIALMTRLRARLPPVDWSPMLGLVATQVERDARRATRYDLVSNALLLLDAWLDGHAGPLQLTFPWLRKMMLGRAHVAVLGLCLDPALCSWYVHGLLEVRAHEMAALSERDLALWRQIGIDTVFLDVWADRPQPHLRTDTAAAHRVDRMADTLAPFCPMDDIRDFVRSTVIAGRRPRCDRVVLPLCHPRKTMSEGCVYVEARFVDTAKHEHLDRYPFRFRTLPDGDVRITDLGHMHRLGLDLAVLADAALCVGDLFLRMVERGEPALRRRDTSAVDRALVAYLTTLLPRIGRPPNLALPCADG